MNRQMASITARSRYEHQHLAAVLRAQEWSLPDSYELPVAHQVERGSLLRWVLRVFGEWREFVATTQRGGPNGEERRSPENERPACAVTHPVGVTSRERPAFRLDPDTRRFLAFVILLGLAACCAAVWLS